MTEKPVFSTKPSGLEHDNKTKSNPGRLAEGPIKMRLETKGRGGKAVTILFNLPMTPNEALNLGKDLQSKLGIGGTFKDDAIELRGDVRDKVEKILQDRGLKLKRAGG